MLVEVGFGWVVQSVAFSLVYCLLFFPFSASFSLRGFLVYFMTLSLSFLLLFLVSWIFWYFSISFGRLGGTENFD